MNQTKLRATYIIVSGGHAVQALKLAERMSPYSINSYIIFKEHNVMHKRIPKDSEIYRVTHTYQQIRDLNWFYIVLRSWRLIPSFFESLYAFIDFKTDVVISTGSGPALIPLIAAKILRKKIIYVESVSRIYSSSLCGKLVYLFLADKFFVQWPEAKQKYPKATYAGRLL